jgi:hypothetical protein
MTTACATGLKPTGSTNAVLAYAWCVHGTVADGLVQVDVTVADLDVETAFRVGACPCFVVDGCALASKV